MNSRTRATLGRLTRTLLTDTGTEPRATPTVPMSGARLPAVDHTRTPWPCSTESLTEARLNVRRTAEHGRPDVVYVHGLGGSSTNWTDLGVLLASVADGVAPDLPGFGYSEPAAEFDFRLASHVRVLAEYLDSIGGYPRHLVGNSMGGVIVLLLAARRPDLVRTLTLISPAMPDLRPDPRRLSDPRVALAYLPVVGKPVRRKLAELGPRERARQVIELCYADPSRFPEHRFDELAEEQADLAARPWANAALARSTADIFRTWLRPGARSLWKLASTVRVPTLVIWGGQDRLVSKYRAVPTARSLPSGRLMLLPDAGHVAQMERPEPVARAILGMWESVAAGDWY